MKSNSRGSVTTGLILSLLVVLALPTAASAEEFELDKAHSFFMFGAVRMGVANVYGRFNDYSGTLNLDGDDFESASIEIEIKTESVDTGIERRDAHLRSPDFLNSKQIPTMAFRSTSIKKVSESSFEVVGDLTLHGVTKAVAAAVDLVGRGKDPRGGASLIGFDATFSIQRSDFGMNFMPGFISDEIQIHMAIQAVSR